MNRQVVRHLGDALVDAGAQGAAVRAACRLDVLQRHRPAGVLLAHRAAQEPVAVEHSDLGQVARIVADGDGLADVAGERRAGVAQALEVDAVAPNDTQPGVHDQQQIELLQALGQPRQKTVLAPSVERHSAGLAVGAKVVRAGDEGADGPVQLRQRQARRRGRPAADEVPGQLRQQLGGERAEQPLDLAPALRPPDGGVDHPEAERGRNLVEMAAGEVRAVIDVEHVRDAAHWP